MIQALHQLPHVTFDQHGIQIVLPPCQNCVMDGVSDYVIQFQLPQFFKSLNTTYHESIRIDWHPSIQILVQACRWADRKALPRG